MAKPINVEDFRKLAQKRLPRVIFDYLEGGVEDERGLARNCDAFDRYQFLPKRLRDVRQRDITVELFGQQIAAPFLLAPTGLNGSMWPKGDICLARAAKAAGIPFVLSSASQSTIEDVADKAGGNLWFQLYIVRREQARRFVERAGEAGYNTLVLTVDVPGPGKRERLMRHGVAEDLKLTPAIVLDGILHPRWTLDYLRNGKPTFVNFQDAGAYHHEKASVLRRHMDAGFTWDDLKAMRDAWPRRLVVKGILSLEDVAHAFELGVDGVVLSNHGARQLDSTPAPVHMLAKYTAQTAAVPTQPVMVDGGIRRGSDIVKAIALGAKVVGLGRATLYGLAAAGEQGASDVIALLKHEVDQTLMQLGCATIRELDASFLECYTQRP